MPYYPPANANGGINVSLSGNTSGALALVSTGTLYLAGGNNITLSQNGNSVTISAPNLGGGAADGGNTLAAGTRTAGSNSVVLFSNASGVSFGLDTVSGSVMTASVKTDYALSDHSHGNPTLALTNLTGTTASASNGFTISLSGNSTQSVQSQNFIGAIVSGANGNGTFTSGTLSFKAGNNITLSTGANVFSIHGVAAQTVQTQNFIAAEVSGANGNGTFTSGTLSIKAGNNITLSTGAGVMSIHGVASAVPQTNQTLGLYALSNTVGESSSSTFDARTLSFIGKGVASVGFSNSSVIISVPAGGGAGDGGIFAGAAGTTQTAGTVVWSNSNNVSFGMNASTITATASFAQSVQSQNFIAAIVSGANGDGTYTSGTLSFKAGNNITLSTGANVFSIHGVAAQTTQTQNFFVEIVSGANGNATFSSGTASVKAGNNITLSTGANVWSIHGVAAQTTQTQDFVALIVSGANGNGTYTSGTVSVKTGNTNITLSTGANVFSIFGPAAGAGGGIGLEVQGANGTATFTSGTITVAAGNNVTLSTGANIYSIHAPAGGAGGGATLNQFEPYCFANSNSTLWVPSVGSWYFQPFVLPQNMAPGRINYLVSYSDTSAGILRLSTAASFASNTIGTRSHAHHEADTWCLYTRGTGTNYTRLESLWSQTRGLSISQTVNVAVTNVSNVAVSVTHSMSYIGAIGTDGAYTMSTTSLSTASSSASVSMATSAFTAPFSSWYNMLTGRIMGNVGLTLSLSPGNYWLAGAYSTSRTTGGSSVADIRPFVQELGIHGISSQQWRVWGATASNTSSQWFPGGGVYSAASAAAPATVAFNAIRSIASHITQYFNIVQSSLS